MPGTHLDIRLDENNIPKSGEEPINAIDQLGYIHDLAYQNSNIIEDRHRADQEMINGLKKLKRLWIPQRLIRQLIIRLFQEKIKLGQALSRTSKQQALNIINNEKQEKREILANELRKPFRKPPQHSKLYFRSKDNIWNADLIIISKPEKIATTY